MEGQSYYYNNKTKNICLINKDLLGLLFKNQKIKNASKILAKSYEDIAKSKDVPFEMINKNYYKWKVTNTDFIIITLDKSLDETLTFLKIPTNNYKATIEEVNIGNKIDLGNLKQYKKLEDYDATTNIQLFKGVIDKYFDIVNISSSEVKTISNTNNLYEAYCILDNTILYTVRFQLNQDNTIMALIVFNTKVDLPKCLKDFVKENGNKIQKIFNSWNEFIVFLELLPKDLDNDSNEDLLEQLANNLKNSNYRNSSFDDDGTYCIVLPVLMDKKYDIDYSLVFKDASKFNVRCDYDAHSFNKKKVDLDFANKCKTKLLENISLINERLINNQLTYPNIGIDADFNVKYINLPECGVLTLYNKDDNTLGFDDDAGVSQTFIECKGNNNLRTLYNLSDKDLTDPETMINIARRFIMDYKYPDYSIEILINFDGLLTNKNQEEVYNALIKYIGDAKAKYKVEDKKDLNKYKFCYGEWVDPDDWGHTDGSFSTTIEFEAKDDFNACEYIYKKIYDYTRNPDFKTFMYMFKFPEIDKEDPWINYIEKNGEKIFETDMNFKLNGKAYLKIKINKLENN